MLLRGHVYNENTAHGISGRKIAEIELEPSMLLLARMPPLSKRKGMALDENDPSFHTALTGHASVNENESLACRATVGFSCPEPFSTRVGSMRDKCIR